MPTARLSDSASYIMNKSEHGPGGGPCTVRSSLSKFEHVKWRGSLHIALYGGKPHGQNDWQTRLRALPLPLHWRMVNIYIYYFKLGILKISHFCFHLSYQNDM